MKKKVLTIIIGASMDSDFNELFSEKPFSEIKQAKNTLYLDSLEQLELLLSKRKGLLEDLL